MDANLEQQIIEEGKRIIALEFMVEWFNSHDEAKKDVKEFMRSIFLDSELRTLFHEDELEEQKKLEYDSFFSN